MFTGIVEELGTVLARQGSRLRIGARAVLDERRPRRLHRGERLLPHGGRLRGGPAAEGDGWWEADVSDETFARTNLGDLAAR